MGKYISSAIAALLAFGLLGTSAQLAHADQRQDRFRALEESFFDNDRGQRSQRRARQSRQFQNWDDDFAPRSRRFQRRNRGRDFERRRFRRDEGDFFRAQERAPEERPRRSRRRAGSQGALGQAPRRQRLGQTPRRQRAARPAAPRAAQPLGRRQATARLGRPRAETPRKPRNQARNQGKRQVFENNERFCSDGALDCNGFKNER